MTGDLTVSEKRLIAALDRIDYTIERAAASLRGTSPAPEGAADIASQAENQRLVAELAAAQERQEAAVHALETRLAQAHARLDEAGQQAARLVAANEALTHANRQLLSKADSGGADDADIRAALEAEVEALRAARAAEIAQMGEIIESIDRLTLAPAPRRASSKDKPAGQASAKATNAQTHHDVIEDLTDPGLPDAKMADLDQVETRG